MKASLELYGETFRQREANRLERTKVECYKATSSGFIRSDGGDQLYSPVLDERQVVSGKRRPVWPNEAPFAVCLTHDVDNVSQHDTRIHFRALKSQALHLLTSSPERKALGAIKGSALSLFDSIFNSGNLDPLHCYERWLNVEAEFGAKSTFLFLPESYDRPHFSDGGYRYTDVVRFDGQQCTVSEMIREIHLRGWEIGLHPSWHTFRSAANLCRDKERLEEIIQAPVVSARQHFLHFDIRYTPQAYQEAGLLYDSSIGFNDDIGFRTGSCWPQEICGDSISEGAGVLELPLIIQDKCLTRMLGLGDLQRSVESALDVAAKVEEVGGVLTLLWHPRLITDTLSMEVYRGLLQQLRERGAWFGTMAEVGSWWAKESARWN